MVIKELSIPTVQGLHKLIQKALDEDDQDVREGRERAYCVRDTTDWRQTADEFEKVMTDKALPFKPIDWTD